MTERNGVKHYTLKKKNNVSEDVIGIPIQLLNNFEAIRFCFLGTWCSIYLSYDC